MSSQQKSIFPVWATLLTTVLTLFLLLCGGLALEAQTGWFPLPVVQAASLTCAATRGTQQAVCEHQDPLVQGCTRDGRPTVHIAVFTAENQHIGTVEVIHSARCHASWIRTTAAAQVRGVSAIATAQVFPNGPPEQRHLAVPPESSHPTILLSVMSSDQTAIVTGTLAQRRWGGLFFVQGHNPIVIPVIAPPSLPETVPLTAAQAPPPTRSSDSHCRSAPSPAHCTNQDPQTQGCTQDARTLSFLQLTDPQGTVVAILQRRYSPTCQSEWGRLVTIPPTTRRSLTIGIGSNGTRTGSGSVLFSTMVFVPQLSRAALIRGSVGLTIIPVVQGKPEQVGILQPLPATQL